MSAAELLGRELQGDSLLIAPVNVLLTFAERYEARDRFMPDSSVLQVVTDIVVWSVLQMDGLTGRHPTAMCEVALQTQSSTFDIGRSDRGDQEGPRSVQDSQLETGDGGAVGRELGK